MNAMRHGRRPDGANYFPGVSLPVVHEDRGQRPARPVGLPAHAAARAAAPARQHDLRFPFGWRFTVTFWKWLFFTPGPFTGIPGATPAVNRGAYLVQALGHCGECHTPRNFLGGPKTRPLPRRRQDTRRQGRLEPDADGPQEVERQGPGGFPDDRHDARRRRPRRSDGRGDPQHHQQADARRTSRR